MTDPENIQHWDSVDISYDATKYNWASWALSVIHELFPHVTCLENLHNEVSDTELVKLQKHVQNACSRTSFMKMFDKFAESLVPQRINGKRYMIQRQGTLRVVVPNQDAKNRRLAFHQGIFVGNGRGLRTIWTPLTECCATNTMWIMDLDNSKRITQQVLDEEWSLDEFEKTCMEFCRPVELTPGRSHLFTQEHIHGNVNNEEDYTRVSIDMRILIEGGEYGRKLPGGYFRLPGDYEVNETYNYTGKNFITYAGWNSAFTKGIPLPMQRTAIDEYCNKHSIEYVDYQFENEFMDWQPSLESHIKQRPYGIVMCSMFALTDNKQRRNELLELALSNNVELHFANELSSLRSRDDLERIQTYLDFAVASQA